MSKDTVNDIVMKRTREICRAEFLAGFDSGMRERDIEKYFKGCVVAAGGEIRKVKWVNRPHAPDRVVFLRGVYFVELKRPGEDLRPGQARERKRMLAQGADVRTISTVEGVDAFIQEIRAKRQDQW